MPARRCGCSTWDAAERSRTACRRDRATPARRPAPLARQRAHDVCDRGRALARRWGTLGAETSPRRESETVPPPATTQPPAKRSLSSPHWGVRGAKPSASALLHFLTVYSRPLKRSANLLTDLRYVGKIRSLIKKQRPLSDCVSRRTQATPQPPASIVSPKKTGAG